MPWPRSTRLITVGSRTVRPIEFKSLPAHQNHLQLHTELPERPIQRLIRSDIELGNTDLLQDLRHREQIELFWLEMSFEPFRIYRKGYWRPRQRSKRKRRGDGLLQTVLEKVNIDLPDPIGSVPRSRNLPRSQILHQHSYHQHKLADSLDRIFWNDRDQEMEAVSTGSLDQMP